MHSTQAGPLHSIQGTAAATVSQTQQEKREAAASVRRQLAVQSYVDARFGGAQHERAACFIAVQKLVDAVNADRRPAAPRRANAIERGL